MRRTRRTRNAFTLVEMLVAAALCMFIMVILTGAFQAGIDAFRNLKAAGDMQDKLRGAADILRRDLSSAHFNGPFQPGLSGPYLSDQRLDKPGWMPPPGGFFRLWQLPAGSVNEGADAEGLPSSRASTHILHFTTQLSGKRPGEYFSGRAPAAFFTPSVPPAPPFSPDLPAFSQNPYYTSRWGEIVYFLGDTGTKTPGGLPIYTLYRRVRVLPTALPPPTALTGVTVSQFPEISQNSDVNPSLFNSLSDVTDPSRRMGSVQGNPVGIYESINGQVRPRSWREVLAGSNAGLSGEDILLTDVISFEVRATWQPHPTPTGAIPSPRPAFTGTPPNAVNLDSPFDDLPASGYTNSVFNPAQVRVFDTWSRGLPGNVDWDNAVTDTTVGLTPGYLQTATATQVPLRVRITALQIRIRVRDQKTQQARQITIVQEM